MKKLQIFSIAILLLFLSLSGVAQINKKQIKKNNKKMSNFKGQKNDFSKKRYLYMGGGINTMNYFGDIAPKSGIFSTKISSTRPGLTGMLGYRIGPRYTIQASLSYGVLFSDDNIAADPIGDNSKYRYVRNLHFRNNIYEFSVVGIIDLYKNEGSYLSRVEITPYALIGIAGFHHNPKAKAPATNVHTGAAVPEAGQWVSLRPLGTEGQYANLEPTDANFGIKPYSLWQASIPFGLGLRYRLGSALDFSFDITFRYLFFDYIDDLSSNYVDLGVLDGDLAKVMSDRSREPVGAFSGDARDLAAWPEYTYDGRDGNAYNVTRGFGHESFYDKRGGASDNDIYYVTSLKVSYVIGASFRRAKFR